jgi:hypothetical protein
MPEYKDKTTVALKMLYDNGKETKAVFTDNNTEHTLGQFIETFIRPLLLTVGYCE